MGTTNISYSAIDSVKLKSAIVTKDIKIIARIVSEIGDISEIRIDDMNPVDFFLSDWNKFNISSNDDQRDKIIAILSDDQENLKALEEFRNFCEKTFEQYLNFTKKEKIYPDDGYLGSDNDASSICSGDIEITFSDAE